MENSFFSRIAAAFRMNDEAWRRHANPWSVLTRFAAIPAMILAIWSRAWIGWWALLPISMTLVWLWVNPRVFPPVSATSSWAAKGIFGERLWLEEQSGFPHDYGPILRWLMSIGVVGFIMIAWGLFTFHVWVTINGTVLVIMAQLWRIDRLGILYESITSNKLGSAQLDATVDGDYRRHD